MRIEAKLHLFAHALHTIARAASSREACGVVTADLSIEEVENRGGELPVSDGFNMGCLSDLEGRFGDLAAIWHTHPGDEPPSPQDVASCRITATPWIIAGPTKLWVLHPRPLKLEEREFVYGADDCWALVSDWYAAERSLFLPWFPRPPDGWWKEAGPSPYLEQAEAYGFEVQPFAGPADLQVGDVLLMLILGKRVNHAAVYVGGGNILHHFYGYLSRIEIFDGRLQGFTTHRARLKAL